MTLVKLLARLYDATSGSVRVDGVDLRELGSAAVPATARRGTAGGLPFSGTVRDDIGYGRPDATDAQIEAAARAVGAHAAIARLPFGYLTSVGERGRSLSAGQRQLVSLARAELVDPDILLLDEATAALDLATEAEYIAATERIRGTRTSVIVAHRLTDRIPRRPGDRAGSGPNRGAGSAAGAAGGRRGFRSALGDLRRQCPGRLTRPHPPLATAKMITETRFWVRFLRDFAADGP